MLMGTEAAEDEAGAEDSDETTDAMEDKMLDATGAEAGDEDAGTTDDGALDTAGGADEGSTTIVV